MRTSSGGCQLISRHDGRGRRSARQERELTEDFADTRLVYEATAFPDLDVA